MCTALCLALGRAEKPRSVLLCPQKLTWKEWTRGKSYNLEKKNQDQKGGPAGTKQQRRLPGLKGTKARWERTLKGMPGVAAKEAGQGHERCACHNSEGTPAGAEGPEDCTSELELTFLLCFVCNKAECQQSACNGFGKSG